MVHQSLLQVYRHRQVSTDIDHKTDHHTLEISLYHIYCFILKYTGDIAQAILTIHFIANFFHIPKLLLSTARELLRSKLN